MVARVYLGESTASRRKSLQEALEYIGLIKELTSAHKVFVKPNLTFPRPVPGVTTSRELLREALSLFSDHGAEVFVGESNGGYGSFLATEAFAGHGMHEICRTTGAELLDLSREEQREYTQRIGGKETSVRLPRCLVEEMDFAVSIPVLKVHAMTTVSLSMKNLWGCYPTDLRLLEHREIDRKLVLISRLMKARFGIVDAFHGLDEHGPMQGKARFLGKFVASDDLLALDVACARMMGFNPKTILHLLNLARLSTGSRRFPSYEANEDLSKYNWGFSLHRDFIDTLSFACFHSNVLAKVVFDSPMTTPIYKVLGREPHRRLALPHGAVE